MKAPSLFFFLLFRFFFSLGAAVLSCGPSSGTHDQSSLISVSTHFTSKVRSIIGNSPPSRFVSSLLQLRCLPLFISGTFAGQNVTFTNSYWSFHRGHMSKQNPY